MKEFKNAMLIANGGPKQAWEMHTACKNYFNIMKVPKMYQTLNKMTKKEKLEFLTANHDKSKYKDLEGKVDDDLKSAGKRGNVNRT